MLHESASVRSSVFSSGQAKHQMGKLTSKLTNNVMKPLSQQWANVSPEATVTYGNPCETATHCCKPRLRGCGRIPGVNLLMVWHLQRIVNTKQNSIFSEIPHEKTIIWFSVMTNRKQIFFRYFWRRGSCHFVLRPQRQWEVTQVSSRLRS